MRIAKPLLLVITPIGVAEGLYECYRLAGGLLFLMAAMVGVICVAFGTVVATIRREEREEREARETAAVGNAKAAAEAGEQNHALPQRLGSAGARV